MKPISTPTQENQPSMLTSAALLIIALLISGCVPVPLERTTQPGFALAVTDASNTPLTGATMLLRQNGDAASATDSAESSIQRFSANTQGRIVVPLQRDWQVVKTSLIDGIPVTRWLWCVEAPGHMPVSGELYSGADAPDKIILHKATQGSAAFSCE